MPHNFNHLMFDKDAKEGEKASSTNCAGKTACLRVEEWNLTYVDTLPQNYFRRIKELN